MKFIDYTPLNGGHDESWLIKRLDKSQNETKFSLIGSMWWIHSLAILIKESSVDKEKFYTGISRARFEDEILNSIFSSLLMAIDYFNTVTRLAKQENTDNLMRITIIAWYYSIYNGAQAMILSTDGSFPQTHLGTANEWYEKFISRKLIPFPFNYHLNSLVEKEYKLQIKNYEDYNKNDNKKPRDIAAAKGMCCSYLKNTAKWYFETKYRGQIKSTKEFKSLMKINFRTKEAKTLRDRFLASKKISFLHQAYRYRGKSNYRDAPYIAYANALSVNSKEFMTDLNTVLEEFFMIAITYVKKRLDKNIFNCFLNDVIKNTNFEEEIKLILKKIG